MSAIKFFISYRMARSVFEIEDGDGKVRSSGVFPSNAIVESIQRNARLVGEAYAGVL
jgi:hypothetical protein